MKKHEALKFAYDNYPKGCIARFKGAPSVDHVSTGKFQISDPNGDGCWGVFSVGGNYDCFYSTQKDDDGKIDGWAEIVPQEKKKPYDSVKVKTREEAKAVFEYFDPKDLNRVDRILRMYPGLDKIGFEIRFPKDGHAGFGFDDNGTYSNPMSFEQFAEEKGIGLAKPDGLMDGKVAIQVNNEREFKLLMEHYQSKGWFWLSGHKPLEYECISRPPFAVYYSDRFTTSCSGKIIPFADFAKEKGIKAPVKIMVSEDGVDLYEGDKLYEVIQVNGIWKISYAKGDGYWVVGKSADKWKLTEKDGYNSKAFSTKEAAEKWIEEKNKPKKQKAILDDGRHAIVEKGSILIYNGPECIIKISPSDLYEMLISYKKLQSESNKNI